MTIHTKINDFLRLQFPVEAMLIQILGPQLRKQGGGASAKTYDQSVATLSGIDRRTLVDLQWYSKAERTRATIADRLSAPLWRFISCPSKNRTSGMS